MLWSMAAPSKDDKRDLARLIGDWIGRVIGAAVILMLLYTIVSKYV